MHSGERLGWFAVIVLAVIITAGLSGDTKTETVTKTNTVTKTVQLPGTVEYIHTQPPDTSGNKEACDSYFKAVDRLDKAMDDVGSTSGEIDNVVQALAKAAFDPDSLEAVQLQKRINKLNDSLTPIWLDAGKAQADMQRNEGRCRGK